MGLVALFAVDLRLPGITNVANPLTRIGLFGALPMVNGLAFYLVLLRARLRRHGEMDYPAAGSLRRWRRSARPRTHRRG